MKKVFIIFFVILLTSCTQRFLDVSAISTRQIEVSNIDLSKYQQKKDITGEDKKNIILLFPVGLPKITKAVDNALDKGDGDLLINASIDIERKWFVLFGYKKVIVNGTVINTRRLNNEK